MNNMQIVFIQVLILSIEISVGYILAKKSALPSDALHILTPLCTKVALPCAVIQSVSGVNKALLTWSGIGIGLGLILITTLAQICISSLFFKGEPLPERVAYQMSCVYGNSAFMGLPLVNAIVGSDAIVYTVMLVIFETVCLFTHCSLYSSKQKITPRFVISKLCNSVTLSMILGAILCISGLKLPSFINACLNDFKLLLTPLAMLIVGIQLAHIDISKVLSCKKYYTIALIKLILYPLFIIACLLPLRAYLAPAMICAIVICKATPQSAVLGPLAEVHNFSGHIVAGIIGLTAALSIITLPLISIICAGIFL